MKNLKILLTNDDGYDAPGLQALKEELSKWGRCFISAPFDQRSASGHGVTLHQRIRVEKRYEKRRLAGYAIRGTPADCVKFAFSEYFRREKPDLVVSGINPGPNTGASVYYSGTIAAAREALFYHVPAFAVSISEFKTPYFRHFAAIAAGVIQKTFKAVGGIDFFYNINIPARTLQPKGIRITHQSHSRFEERFIPMRWSGKGKREYLLRGKIALLKETGDSDEEAMRKGYISLTPCQLDTSAYLGIEKLKKVFPKTAKGCSKVRPKVR
jgi:5'-nucleotidase